MAHKRNRTDYKMVAYRYYLRPTWRPIKEVPPPALDEYRRMVDLWNKLVDQFMIMSENYNELLLQSDEINQLQQKIDILYEERLAIKDELKKLRQQSRKRLSSETEHAVSKIKNLDTEIKTLRDQVKERKSVYKEEIKPRIDAIYQDFYARIDELCYQSTAYWCNKEAIRDNFLATCKRFFSRQGGPPYYHSAIMTPIALHHRFTGGGLPLEQIHNNRTKTSRFSFGHSLPGKIAYEKLDDSVLHRISTIPFSFDVSGNQLNFICLLHRPLPSQGFLKKIILNRITEADYVRWYVSFVLEVPAEEYYVQDDAWNEGKKDECSIDVGYRLRIAKDVPKSAHGCKTQIRVGYLRDNTGYEQELLLSPKIVATYEYINQLKSDRQLAFNRIKEWLQKNMGIRLSKTLLGEGLLRQPMRFGYRKMYRLINELQQFYSDSREEVITAKEYNHLNLWQEMDLDYWRTIVNLSRKMYGFKKWHYQNLAKQLCQQYKRIIVENIDLNQLARKGDNIIVNNLPDKVRYYRVVASLYLFFDALKQQADKHQIELIFKEPKYTTMMCHRCLTVWAPKKREDLFWQCPECHSLYDQDANAAINLLGNISQT